MLTDLLLALRVVMARQSDEGRRELQQMLDRADHARQTTARAAA